MEPRAKVDGRADIVYANTVFRMGNREITFMATREENPRIILREWKTEEELPTVIDIETQKEFKSLWDYLEGFSNNKNEERVKNLREHIGGM